MMPGNYPLLYRQRLYLFQGDRHGPQLYIKGKRSWSEQLGVAIACLIDAGQMDLIDWTKEVCLSRQV